MASSTSPLTIIWPLLQPFHDFQGQGAGVVLRYSRVGFDFPVASRRACTPQAGPQDFMLMLPLCSDGHQRSYKGYLPSSRCASAGPQGMEINGCTSARYNDTTHEAQPIPRIRKSPARHQGSPSKRPSRGSWLLIGCPSATANVETIQAIGRVCTDVYLWSRTWL